MQLSIAINSNLRLNKGSSMPEPAVCGNMAGFPSIFVQI